MKKLLIILMLFSTLSQAKTFEFEQKHPSEIDVTYKVKIDNNSFSFKNDLQDIKISKKVSFGKRIDLLKEIKDHNLIGQIEVNEEITYSGIYGDITALTIDDLIEEKEKNKKFLIKNLKKVGNQSMAFSKNAIHYKKILNDEHITYITKKIVGEGGSVILFETNIKNHKIPLIMGTNKKNELTIVPLEKVFNIMKIKLKI